MSFASTFTEVLVRWLIDNDHDMEGMRVIADLHGGDPENELAKAEFREIKDKVMSEVRLHECSAATADLTITSVATKVDGHTDSCGNDIVEEFCLPCLLKHLHNWSVFIFS